ELFGYEKGAFTGAVSAKAGLFETSGGGTLFFDEIGELTLGLQAKLLKAVEEKRIRRVGGTYEREIDVRIVAATSRDLTEMVRDGSFRPDLFDRLNILQLETIPLRRQKERIRVLFLHQMEVERPSVGRDVPFVIEEEALREIEQTEWRGNYRELRNFATRLAVEAMDLPVITIDVIRKTLRPICSPGGAGAAVKLPEPTSDRLANGNESARRNFITVILDPDTDDLDSVYVKAAATFIEHALRQTNGNLRRAARSMGTTHSTLSRILKKYHERSGNSPNIPQQSLEHRSLAYSAAA
ncbi:MAG: sigma 54-interacting transcriptional regulator, partial [Blastocatellia bacterium]|nr:sigma 54-interacting transcriptional regulator [Blastocatellia bacterium]